MVAMASLFNILIKILENFSNEALRIETVLLERYFDSI